MNADQYQALQNSNFDRLLTADNLADKTPRTLVYGYTCTGDSWHVFLDHDGQIKTVAYSSEKNPLQTIDITNNRSFVPDKRIYPQFCDFEFCSLLKSQDVPLPFTFADFEHVKEGPFFGRTE